MEGRRRDILAGLEAAPRESGQDRTGIRAGHESAGECARKEGVRDMI